jgi:hypothetical protein
MMRNAPPYQEIPRGIEVGREEARVESVDHHVWSQRGRPDVRQALSNDRTDKRIIMRSSEQSLSFPAQSQSAYCSRVNNRSTDVL